MTLLSLAVASATLLLSIVPSSAANEPVRRLRTKGHHPKSAKLSAAGIDPSSQSTTETSTAATGPYMQLPLFNRLSKSKKSRSAKSGKMFKGCDQLILSAQMGKYPGYEGDVEALGTVTASFLDGGTTKLAFKLQGLEASCEECGIHIHSGTTCDDASLVGGHYFAAGTADPWTKAGGAIYTSDASGNADGSFEVTSGYDTYADNVGHAVVIHSADGTRVSCGVLAATNKKSGCKSSHEDQHSISMYLSLSLSTSMSMTSMSYDAKSTKSTKSTKQSKSWAYLGL